MINSDALISIIVPVYGTEQYLPDCIESLCNQTYPRIEIILVDDQSPDKCPEICDDYAQKDSRIIVIHQENKGVSGARNTGMRHATGDYIMFVDSDDALYSDAVEKLLQDAIQYNADIVSAQKSIVNQQGRIITADEKCEYVIYHNEEAIKLSLEGEKNTNSACAKLYKVSFIKDVFFEEGKNIHEDGFFIFQCYLRRPLLVQHNVPVYQCNYREDSNSRQKYSDKYLSMLYFCEEKEKLISIHYPQYHDLINNLKVRTHLQFLQVLCSTTEKRCKKLEKQSVKIVRQLFEYHKPINKHHKKLAWIVRLGLYPLYKAAVLFKYYR